MRLAAILLVLELTGASAIKCYYAARGISTTAVAGLCVRANAIASGSINIDTDVRVHTKTSLSVIGIGHVSRTSFGRIRGGRCFRTRFSHGTYMRD